MVINSALATSASGSIGGLTASRGQGRIVLGKKPNPTDRNSELQQTVRESFGYLTNFWSNVLTDSERASWSLYAKNVATADRQGHVIHLNGLNQFVRTNSLGIFALRDVQTTAPSQFSLATLVTGLNVSNAGGPGVQFSWSPGSTEDGNVLIFAGRPQNQSIQYFRGPYRYAGTQGTSAGTVTITNANLGVADGQKQFYRLVVLDDLGRVSPDLQTFIVIG